MRPVGVAMTVSIVIGLISQGFIESVVSVVVAHRISIVDNASSAIVSAQRQMRQKVLMQPRRLVTRILVAGRAHLARQSMLMLVKQLHGVEHHLVHVESIQQVPLLFLMDVCSTHMVIRR